MIEQTNLIFDLLCWGGTRNNKKIQETRDGFDDNI